MKKVMFAILALPLLAGCFWSDKETKNFAASNEDKSEMTTEASSDLNEKIMAEESDDNVSDEK